MLSITDVLKIAEQNGVKIEHVNMAQYIDKPTAERWRNNSKSRGEDTDALVYSPHWQVIAATEWEQDLDESGAAMGGKLIKRGTTMVIADNGEFQIWNN